MMLQNVRKRTKPDLHYRNNRSSGVHSLHEGLAIVISGYPTSLPRQQNESEVVERLYQFVTPAQTGVQLIKQTVQRIDIKAI